MRILFFAPHQLWPTNSGARIRNLQLATALARHSSVTLLQILQPDEDVASAPEQSEFEQVLSARKARSYSAEKIVRGLAGPLPITVLNYSSPDVAGCLKSALETAPFDTVQLESSHLFSYLSTIRAAPGSPSVLLDWHNIESELMRRYALESPNYAKRVVGKRTATLLGRLEAQLLGSCDVHTVVSQREKNILQDLKPSARIDIVPNGVDTARFSPSETVSNPKTLLFVGSMDYHANAEAVLWFVREIWPTISRRFPALDFIIVGRSPSREVQMLASEKIKITGTVEDVRPYYAKSLAVIVPLRVGGGTRLKILEAMSMGVPVISTKLGAEGLLASDKKDILFADTPEEMTGAIERLVNDPLLRQTLSSAARELVSSHYDWRAIGDRLYSIHSQLSATRSAH